MSFLHFKLYLFSPVHLDYFIIYQCPFSLQSTQKGIVPGWIYFEPNPSSFNKEHSFNYI